jgi:hypothetical protein
MRYAAVKREVINEKSSNADFKNFNRISLTKIQILADKVTKILEPDPTAPSP